MLLVSHPRGSARAARDHAPYLPCSFAGVGRPPRPLPAHSPSLSPALHRSNDRPSSSLRADTGRHVTDVHVSSALAAPRSQCGSAKDT
eukprot:304150-Rhodomonas_salina.2